MFSSLWLGDPVKDYDQPREHENVNYRKFYIRPKSKPQSRFDMIVKGNFYNYILIEYQKKNVKPEGVINQGSRYNGEYVKVAAHGLGDPVKD